MNNYKILDKEQFSYGSYSIQALRHEDIFKIMKWRNEQMDVLRQDRVLQKHDQEDYYQKAILPSYSDTDPAIILFSFLYESNCIGYGGLTNVDWDSRRAELSFLLATDMINDNKLYAKSFSVFLNLVKEVAFTELKLHRIFTETYDFRPFHIEVLEKEGFALEGRMRDHLRIKNKYVDSLIHGLINNR